MWRTTTLLTREHSVSLYNDREAVILVGTVVREPQERLKNTKLTVAAETLTLSSGRAVSVSGSFLVFAPRFSRYQYGQRLRIEGKLQSPQEFAEFDYPAYLAKDSIYSVMYRASIEELSGGGGNLLLRTLFSFRQKTEASIGNILPAPQSALLRAILLGDEGEMTQELKAALNRTGLRHIVAISGMNITLIAGILMRFFLRVGLWRHHAFWFAVGGVALFVLFVGAPATAVRAGIMGGLYLLAEREGRRYSGISAVVGAAAIMAFVQPHVLRWDIGFQLSFLAVLGLFLFTEYFQRIFSFLPKEFELRNIAAMTTSASLPTVPVLVASFHQVPLIGIFTNLLVLPWLAITTIAGFFAAWIGIFVPSLGQIVAAPLFVPTTILLWAAETFQSFPVATFSFSGTFGWTLTALYFLALIFFARFAARRIPKPIDLARDLP